MKKLYFLFMIVVLLSIGILGSTLYDPIDSVAVLNEVNPTDNRYYLSFENENIILEKVLDIFSSYSVEIKKIYPKNRLVIDDPKIEEQLFSFSYYDLKTLKESYLQILDKYGLEEDILKVEQYGILLDKIEIKTDYQTLNALRGEFPNLLYSYQLNGSYQ